MTSNPASRSARATTFAPRSWPSRPGLAMRTRGLGCACTLVTRPVGVWLIELDQHTAPELGQHESHLTDSTRLWLRVHEFDAALTQPGHGGRQVVDLQADVVQTGSTPLEESADGVVLARRLQQLDLRIAELHE